MFRKQPTRPGAVESVESKLPKNEKRRRQIELLRGMPEGLVAVEVGVYKGAHAALILEHMKPRKLTLIDPWAWREQWHVQHTNEEIDSLGGGGPLAQGEEIYRSVCERFAGDPRVEIVRAPSVEAAEHIADASIDWAFIDGDHRAEPALADLRAWWPKLKPGGVISGDDLVLQNIFKPDHPNGVATAVHKFVSEQGLDLDLRRLRGGRGDGNLTYQFIIRKPDG